MANKTRSSRPLKEISNNPQQQSSQGEMKQSDRYIFVSQQLFQPISQLMNCVDWILLRDGEKFKYNKAPEDLYAHDPREVFWAEVYRSKQGFEDMLVYVVHQGRLYSCRDIIEASTLIEEIKAKEDLKIISQQ